MNLLSNTSNSFPSISINLYDGGDGTVTLADVSKSTFNVAQSQDITSTGVFTTSFFSVIPLNNRTTDFPSGILGLSFAPRVEGLQTGIWSNEAAISFGLQPPVLNITYVPEPASLSVLFLGAGLLLRRRK